MASMYKNKKLAWIGYGAFGREVMASARPILAQPLSCGMELFMYGQYAQLPMADICRKYQCAWKDISQFNPDTHVALVTVADPAERERLVLSLPEVTEYYTYVDPRATLLDPETIRIGPGSIICAGSILTCNISLGAFTQLNLGTTIGHDTVLGNFCTTAPGVRISGTCTLGTRVYLGTNAAVRPHTVIADKVVVGMGAAVVGNLYEPGGTYTGVPARLVK